MDNQEVKHGNGISINIPLQAVGPANGGTVFLPWTKGEGTKTVPPLGRAHFISPELPAGSLLLYDYTVRHRAGKHTRPEPSARWMLYQIVHSRSLGVFDRNFDEANVSIFSFSRQVK